MEGLEEALRGPRHEVATGVTMGSGFYFGSLQLYAATTMRRFCRLASKRDKGTGVTQIAKDADAPAILGDASLAYLIHVQTRHGDTPPHAHELATASSHDAMLRLLRLAHSLGVDLLPRLSEIRSTGCPCRRCKSVCEHITALIERYARTLEHEPLTLLLLNGTASTDFFAIVDDPERPSAQPYYRPKSLTPPTTGARNRYYRRQWHTTPSLPPLPTPRAGQHPAAVRTQRSRPCASGWFAARGGRAVTSQGEVRRAGRG